MYQSNIWNLFHLCRLQIVSVLFFICLTFTTTVVAQNMPKHDNKTIHFGMSLGLPRGNFMVTHSEAFNFHDSIKVVDSPTSAGFNVGIISDLHLTKHADLRFIPSLIFVEKDLRYTEISDEGDQEVTKTIESIILSAPLLFKYKSDRFFDNFRFYAIGGGRFDWDLQSNSKARRAKDIVKLARYDVAVEYGIGLEFYFPLFIFSPEIKISQGLSNLHVPTENLRFSEVIDKLRSKYITISFQFEG